MPLAFELDAVAATTSSIGCASLRADVSIRPAAAATRAAWSATPA